VNKNRLFIQNLNELLCFQIKLYDETFSLRKIVDIWNSKTCIAKNFPLQQQRITAKDTAPGSN